MFLFIFYCFFNTQDTAMHNSKFKKSIASNTIKNSLSKTSLPRHSFVLFLKMGWDGGVGVGGGCWGMSDGSAVLQS